MKTRNILLGAGVVALSAGLSALPGSSATRSLGQGDPAKSDQKVREFRSDMDLVRADRALQTYVRALGTAQEAGDGQDKVQNFSVLLGDDDASWLGVETQEVTSEFAKEHKLSAERGVVLGKVISDSPAAKSGLKENDVVTEINGQRVEGTAQFRRMIREIPAGRTVQLGIVREGQTQSITVTLGHAEPGQFFRAPAAPGNFKFRIPDVPEMPEVMEIPGGNAWGNAVILGGQPRLGIDAEDLSGQLGTFFGAPDGEGILVRGVNAGSPAEKAGLKAGDVITSLDGERIRTTGELREKLSAKRGEKTSTVKINVLRNKSEVSLTVELPAPSQKAKRSLVMHRTNI